MSNLNVALIGIGVFFATLWFLHVTRAGGEIDSRGVYSRLHRAWRRIAFWAGDVKRIHHFPFITWSHSDYDISYESWLEAIKHARPGDVGLATKNGYFLSNSAIPGVFKHALLFTKGATCIEIGNRLLCDVSDARIVEAISEGVVQHHPLHARGDAIIILRPKGAKEWDIEQALERAERIIGCDYDANFDFDVEVELEELARAKRVAKVLPSADSISRRLDEAAKDLQVTALNVKAEYDAAFSCTEVVALCWWHWREQLRIYRKPLRGRMAICADQFVNHGFEVVWTNVSVDHAIKGGMHEEGVELIREYWNLRLK